MGSVCHSIPKVVPCILKPILDAKVVILFLSSNSFSIWLRLQLRLAIREKKLLESNENTMFFTQKKIGKLYIYIYICRHIISNIFNYGNFVFY